MFFEVYKLSHCNSYRAIGVGSISICGKLNCRVKLGLSTRNASNSGKKCENEVFLPIVLCGIKLEAEAILKKFYVLKL